MLKICLVFGNLIPSMQINVMLVKEQHVNEKKHEGLVSCSFGLLRMKARTKKSILNTQIVVRLVRNLEK